jgi:uncharacterized protein involved in outer membrane biogenesis
VKKAAWIGGGLLTTLIALLAILPGVIDIGTFKRTYLPRFEEALRRGIDVGEVRLSLIPTPSIRISNLSVSDNPALSTNPFFTAEQLQLRLKLWPLVFGRFEVTEFVLEKPVMTLVKQADGSFHYGDVGGKKTFGSKKPETKKKPTVYRAQDSTPPPLIVPNRVRIKDGQLNLHPNDRQPFTVSGIALSLEDFSRDEPFPFRASLDYPGLKTVSLEGQLSYDAEQATVRLKENRLKAHDLVLPIEGSISSLSTVPRINLIAAGDQLDSKSVLQILSVFGLAPNDMEVSGPMGLRLTLTGPSNGLLTEVRGQFNNVKVHSKRALKGNLSGEVFIKLPLDGDGSARQRLQGDGKFVARDGELTNVDLINKVEKVTGFIGLSQNQRRQATTFKTLEGEFTIKRAVADFTRIQLVNPQMEVSGAGTMTLNQPTLNMSIEAALANHASARAVSGRNVTFFRDRQGRIVVPLRITGRAENPSVNVDTQKMLEKGIPESTQKHVSSFFRQFFQRK